MKKIITSVFLAVFLSLGVSAAGFDFGSGAVYYSFDNQAVCDSATGNYTGSLTGGGAEYTEGLNGGYAVKMDNASYVSIPVEVTCLKEEMSIIVWFKTASLNGAWNRIISTGVWGAQPAPGVLIGIYNATDTGIQYAAVGIGADDASKNHWNLITAPEGQEPYRFDDDKWHCFGYTVGGGIGGLFLDGNLIYTFEYDADNCSVATYEETACIGGFLYYDNLNEPFAGTVDEIYFLPFQIDAAVMREYYDAETEGRIEHIAADPPVSSEENTSVADESSETADGTSAGDNGSSAIPESGKPVQTDGPTTQKTGENAETFKPVPIVIASVAVAAVIIVALMIVIKKEKKKSK